MVKKCKKGFTLIELMLVISIIIVISGFIFPKFIKYEEKAKKVKAINAAKQIYTAVMSIYSDGSSSLNESNIKNSVKDLTGDNVDANIGTNIINITYRSDNKPYTLIINTADGGYTVKDDTKAIFSQN
jgi:type IV pilus assembly protein PilA